MASSKVYWTYWGTCFATVITWVFAVAAAADDAWISINGETLLELGARCDLVFEKAVCERYDAATAFQFIATVLVSFALVVVVLAAFTSPPTTGVLGLALGIMLAMFSLFQMIAFSLMAAMVVELNNSDFAVYWGVHDFEAGPTVGVAVMAWLLGLAGAIIILVLRKRATNDDEGPFRKCMSGGGGMAAGASAGQHVGTV